MDAFSENNAMAPPLTYETLMNAYEAIANAPYQPHVHLVSADAARRVRAGGRAFCVGCGALIEMIEGEVRAHF